MGMRVLGLVAVLVAVAGCGGGGLSEASAQACSEGKASATQARTFVDNGPPEVMIELAEAKAPEFEGLAAKADNEGVKGAFTELAKVFAEFKPDMSKVPTALRPNAEFTRYVDEFKAKVGDRTDKLNAACS